MIKLVVWSFEGTLALRRGSWCAAILEAARQVELDLDADALACELASALPWHTPLHAHCHLSSADLWWDHVNSSLQNACERSGVDFATAGKVARRVRQIYCNPAAWALFPEVVGSLRRLADAGWSHSMLANAVPELDEIVMALGIRASFCEVVSSAVSGYEKPHWKAYRAALNTVAPGALVWMVGSDAGADISDVAVPGFRTLLVRISSRATPYCVTSLSEAADIIEASDSSDTTCRLQSRSPLMWHGATRSAEQQPVTSTDLATEPVAGDWIRSDAASIPMVTAPRKAGVQPPVGMRNASGNQEFP